MANPIIPIDYLGSRLLALKQSTAISGKTVTTTKEDVHATEAAVTFNAPASGNVCVRASFYFEADISAGQYGNVENNSDLLVFLRSGSTVVTGSTKSVRNPPYLYTGYSRYDYSTGDTVFGTNPLPARMAGGVIYECFFTGLSDAYTWKLGAAVKSTKNGLIAADAGATYGSLEIAVLAI